jgi:glycosyltransferase involved in cell wall biosynthesis
MNILYVIHQFYPEFHSGTENFLLNLALTLQKAGHLPHVVTYGVAKEDAWKRRGSLLVKEYGYSNLPVVALQHKISPIDLNTSCHNMQIYQFALKYLKKQKRCDLVHIAHAKRLSPFAEAALCLKIPYALTLTDFWLICPKTILQTSSGTLCAGPQGGNACRELCPELSAAFVKSRLAFVGKLLEGAKSIVAPSKFLAAIFNKEFPELPIRIIPHGIDFKSVKPRARIYREAESVVFGYCGALLPNTGVHVLLKAFVNLNSKNTELKLYGSYFHEKDYFHSLQGIAGRDARIKFCGACTEEQTGEIPADIDVLVLPSVWYENYPFMLHEAMACNIPVIASNLGGIAEDIENSINGLTFQVGDELDLGKQLKLVLDNPEILNGLKKKITEYVPPRIEEEAYMYERLYRMIASPA